MDGSDEQEPTAIDKLPNLPIPRGWSCQTFCLKEIVAQIGWKPVSKGTGLPHLPGLHHHYAVHMRTRPQSAYPTKRKGWQRAGPGPKRGRTRIPNFQDVHMPFLIAIIHLAKEAIHFQQLYSFQSAFQDSHLDFVSSMAILSEMEDGLPVSKAMKKCIWPLSYQLGVPGFLVKLRSPYYSIAVHFLPDRPGTNWVCSKCKTSELCVTPACAHTNTVNQCVTEVTESLGCSTDYLLCSMTQSSAFNHIPELSTTGFYGFKTKLEYAILRSERKGPDAFQAPITYSSHIHIAKRISNTQGWKCLDTTCSGNSTSCMHQRAVDSLFKKGVTHSFSSVQELIGSQQPTNRTLESETETSDIKIPRHSRPIIPTDTAFRVDELVSRNASNKTTQLLLASKTCHCGKTLYDESSSDVSRCILRVEAMRCFVNYEQEVWYCSEGHCVTPEENNETREGLLWLSRNTAYTEVFLFEMLLHMTIGGATISSQSDIRSQILYLQTNNMGVSDQPRSVYTVRKALISYAMAVVQSIPQWVFRCSNCATSHNGKVYYEKLSFDGQQLGFNIRKDVRYDFYGKPTNPWRRPVDRCSEAPKFTMIIESKHLRAIVMESLRVRDIPIGCSSVQTLCRAMMKIPLRTRDTICAAVAAIKLFDSNWANHVGPGTGIPNESNFQDFLATSSPHLSAHPIDFIVNVDGPELYDQGLRVIDIFRSVLDCTTSAAVISILLTDLRADLKAHIPISDVQFLHSYASYSLAALGSWISYLSHSQPSWSTVLPTLSEQDIQDSMPSGIAEHADFLDHPFRPPFAWKQDPGASIEPTWRGTRIVHVRPVGYWTAPDDAQTAIFLLFMALLTENVTVWIRDGTVNTLRAAEEAFRNAEMYCGHADSSFHYRASLQAISSITLLYEGIMGMIGANDIRAKPMFKACRRIVELIRVRFASYLTCMSNSISRKQFMCSPKEFDDMLTWTRAFKDASPSHQDISHASQMRGLYEKLANSKSNDFLETGVWAPDFPIIRPSPSSSTWTSDLANSETCCSKNFSTHTSFSPGTFGAYCLCRHAKTVMISFLKKPEGCRMPLNLIVERCATLPKYVIYDFACGTQRSAVGLSAEITRNVRFVIDPFHFPGHKTCSLAMHQANYAELKGLNVESQEQKNSRIKVMERTLRASRDVHFMHFVVLAHAYFNLKAMYLDHYDSIDDLHESNEYCSKSWLRWVRDNLLSNPQNSST